MLRDHAGQQRRGTLLPEPPPYEKPKCRADCAAMVRPCAFVTCKYHLYLDYDDSNGSLKINGPEEVWEMKESCALDVAERGGCTLEEVGEAMNLTRERARQIEVMAISKLRSAEIVH